MVLERMLWNPEYNAIHGEWTWQESEDELT